MNKQSGILHDYILHVTQILFLFLIPVLSNAQVQSTVAIEEIIVTAEKRETNLQESPIAVTAFTAQGLARANIIGPFDLTGKVPGLTINKNEGPKMVVTIRGIGHEANQNGQSIPGVALHTDGVFMPLVRSLGAGFLDVERVEVLRGPQGTVFGQNSTGGTINIISKKPVIGEFSGSADLTVGTDAWIQPRVSVNVPFSDTFAARGSFFSWSHDGFAEIIDQPGSQTGLAGFELDDTNEYGARIQFLWEPNDRFSAILRGQIHSSDTHDNAERNILDISPDPRKLSYNNAGLDTFEQTVFSLELAYETSFATFKSLTAYQDVESTERGRDSDRGIPVFQFAQQIVRFNDQNTEIFTQEFNLISNTDGRLDWLVGAFYMDFDNFRFFDDYRDVDGDGVIDFFKDDNGDGRPNDASFRSKTPAIRTSYSVYAEGTYHITDDFRITAGLRYTDDEIDALPTTQFRVPDPTANFLSTVEKTTWKATLQWDLQDDVMAYITASTGLKPGGVNTLADLGTGSTLIDEVFKEEEVQAYELGLKSRFADGRFQLNAAAFYYDYENFQFHTENFAPFNGGVSNVPQVEIQGAEIEFSGLLSDSFRLDANLSWLDGEVDGSFLVLAPLDAAMANAATFAAGSGLFSPLNFALRAAAVSDINGNTPPKLPEISLYVNLTHELNIADQGFLTSTLSYTYKEEYDYQIYNAPGLEVPSEDLWDLSFYYRPHNGNWSAALLIMNLADDDAVNSRWTNVFGVNQTSEQFFPPRQVLFRLGYEF